MGLARVCRLVVALAATSVRRRLSRSCRHLRRWRRSAAAVAPPRRHAAVIKVIDENEACKRFLVCSWTAACRKLRSAKHMAVVQRAAAAVATAAAACRRIAACADRQLRVAQRRALATRHTTSKCNRRVQCRE